MNNIKLNYLYRDGSNYKRFGNVIFINPTNISLEEFKEQLLRNLIDGEFFDAAKLGLPTLFFNESNEDDHEWHELDSIEMTDEPANAETSIEEFLKGIELLNPTAPLS